MNLIPCIYFNQRQINIFEGRQNYEMRDRSSPEKYSGIIVAAVTPFQNDHLYESGISNLVSFLNSKGIDFLFACGTSGEGMIMSVEERKRTVELMIDKS